MGGRAGKKYRRGEAGAVDRRKFLETASALVAGAVLAPQGARADATSGSTAPVDGKDARLIVHTASPVVMETPAELLAAERVTPTELLFVRNNQNLADTATLKPLSPAGWKIELTGLVHKPHTIDAGELAKLPQVEHEMVLQCSGNQRGLFSAAAPVEGTVWGRGGMGNVVFAGVPLAEIVKHYAINIGDSAKFLSAEGQDGPAQGEEDFEHSLPLDEALRKSMIALTMNGKPLAAVHGGPARLVTPGYYGTMHIKWLTRLRFDAEESRHKSHIPRYRTPRRPIVPGEEFEATFANSEPNWPMKIKAVVLSPAPGARVRAGDVEVRGVAFNDGEARIVGVLVSTNRGDIWQPAKLETPKSLYAWYPWQATLKLPPGAAEIWAFAIDALGRSQPSDGGVGWNPHGYAWNGMEKIAVTVG